MKPQTTNLPSSLQRLYEEDANLAKVLDAFTEIDRAYREALKAIGLLQAPSYPTTSSADASITIRTIASSNLQLPRN